MLAFSVPVVAFDGAVLRGPQPADIEGREWRILPDQSRRQSGYLAFQNGIITGSPGCGQFAGTYQRSNDLITISVNWVGDKTHCSGEIKEKAELVLKCFAKIRQIQPEPDYWQSDTLLLADAKGTLQIILEPMQTGKDLSELQDSFWNLAQPQNLNNLSGIVINIEEGAITFSSPSYFISSL